MIKRFFFFIPILLFACNKSDGPRTLNRTCVTTQHHNLVIGDVNIYVKYDATDFNFPGFEDLAEYDTVFSTATNGYGCIDNLPTGKHWLVGIGMDQALKVKGRSFVNITFSQPEVDTILYMGEEAQFCK